MNQAKFNSDGYMANISNYQTWIVEAKCKNHSAAPPCNANPMFVTSGIDKQLCRSLLQVNL